MGDTAASRPASWSCFEAAITESSATVHGVPRRPIRTQRVDAKWVRNLLRARARRCDFIRPKLSSDPAWDMLLALYAAELEQVRLTIAGLTRASRVPGTTALRWMDVLLREGLIQRKNNPFDRRQIFVELSTDGVQAMKAYFANLPDDAYPM